MTDTLRTFFAVPLTHDLLARLADLRRDLEPAARKARSAVRWLTSDLHVTVKFIGATSPAQLPALEQLLAEEAERSPAAHVVGARVTAFASLRRARVIVVELDEPAGALAGLAQRLSRRCQELGFEAEARPFRPHVTLGRLREPARVEGWLEERQITLGSCSLAELVLFRSDLLPSGAAYTPIGRAALTG